MRVRWKLTNGEPVTLRVRKSDVDALLGRFSSVSREGCPFCGIGGCRDCKRCRLAEQLRPHSAGTRPFVCFCLAGLKKADKALDNREGIKPPDSVRTLRNFRRRIRAAAGRATV